MKNRKESQEADKYGKITFGEATKILVDIIGQNVILDLMSEENPKSHKSYKNKLEIMYEGGIPDHGFTNLQYCCEQFFKKMVNDYEVSPLVMTIFDSDLKSCIRDFSSIYTKSNKILNKSKKEIALYLLHTQASRYIYDDSTEKDSLSIILNKDVFKTSKNNVLVFLRDSYKKIFDDIVEIFKNKETFYKEITGLGEDYKQNINNWQNGIVNNPNWKTLVPVLDCLCKPEFIDKPVYIAFVHRLIGLYLRKNAQEAFADLLDVSEDELKEIIEEIANMIEEKKYPEKFPSDSYFDAIWFNGQRIKIVKCLELQNNYENSNDVIESNNIVKYLECNYLRSSEEKFLYFWLLTRAKVFEKHCDLKDHKETKEEIIKGYRKAFDELLKDMEKGPFLVQFLAEIMLINLILNPRRVKAISDYYEYGYTLGIFSADKRDEILNDVKRFRNTDIREALVHVHSKFCPLKISP